ncbi:hypothetical protein N9W61_01470 [Algibacter sp.]|nr:hypothetical protein [Algibacter sp.]
MDALLLLILINAAILIFAHKTKIGLYTISDYRIGSDHIYK